MWCEFKQKKEISEGGNQDSEKEFKVAFYHRHLLLTSSELLFLPCKRKQSVAPSLNIHAEFVAGLNILFI